jgi:hypothetical protein
MRRVWDHGAISRKWQAGPVQRVPKGALLWEGVPGCGLADAQACMQALAGGTVVTALLLSVLPVRKRGVVRDVV